MAVLVAFGSFLTTLLGGFAAMRIGSYRQLMLGLVAGLMLGAVGFDLLPEALKRGYSWLLGVPIPLLAFVLGFLVLHVIEHTVGIHRGQRSTDSDAAEAPSVGLIAASGLVSHSVMDGFAIGAGFQAGVGVGSVVAVAVIGHDFADGFNTYTVTSLYGNDRRRALTLLTADAAAPVVGAALTLAISLPLRLLDVYLGFFAGFLMYLASADILPRADTGHRTLVTLACTIGGVLFMLSIVGLASCVRSVATRLTPVGNEVTPPLGFKGPKPHDQGSVDGYRFRWPTPKEKRNVFIHHALRRRRRG